jgi:hypothetical protein
MNDNRLTDDPTLTSSPSAVLAPVSVYDFHQFISVLKEKPITITNANFGGLSLL